jgi:hypothetical protein
LDKDLPKVGARFRSEFLTRSFNPLLVPIWPKRLSRAARVRRGIRTQQTARLIGFAITQSNDTY